MAYFSSRNPVSHHKEMTERKGAKPLMEFQRIRGTGAASQYRVQGQKAGEQTPSVCAGASKGCACVCARSQSSGSAGQSIWFAHQRT